MSPLPASTGAWTTLAVHPARHLDPSPGDNLPPPDTQAAGGSYKPRRKRGDFS
jgi:hypothetical protein